MSTKFFPKPRKTEAVKKEKGWFEKFLEFDERMSQPAMTIEYFKYEDDNKESQLLKFENKMLKDKIVKIEKKIGKMLEFKRKVIDVK